MGDIFSLPYIKGALPFINNNISFQDLPKTNGSVGSRNNSQSEVDSPYLKAGDLSAYQDANRILDVEYVDIINSMKQGIKSFKSRKDFLSSKEGLDLQRRYANYIINKERIAVASERGSQDAKDFDEYREKEWVQKQANMPNIVETDGTYKVQYIDNKGQIQLVDETTHGIIDDPITLSRNIITTGKAIDLEEMAPLTMSKYGLSENPSYDVIRATKREEGSAQTEIENLLRDPASLVTTVGKFPSHSIAAINAISPTYISYTTITKIGNRRDLQDTNVLKNIVGSLSSKAMQDLAFDYFSQIFPSKGVIDNIWNDEFMIETYGKDYKERRKDILKQQKDFYVPEVVSRDGKNVILKKNDGSTVKVSLEDYNNRNLPEGTKIRLINQGEYALLRVATQAEPKEFYDEFKQVDYDKSIGFAAASGRKEAENENWWLAYYHNNPYARANATIEYMNFANEVWKTHLPEKLLQAENIMKLRKKDGANNQLFGEFSKLYNNYVTARDIIEQQFTGVELQQQLKVLADRTNAAATMFNEKIKLNENDIGSVDVVLSDGSNTLSLDLETSKLGRYSLSGDAQKLNHAQEQGHDIYIKVNDDMMIPVTAGDVYNLKSMSKADRAKRLVDLASMEVTKQPIMLRGKYHAIERTPVAPVHSNEAVSPGTPYHGTYLIPGSNEVGEITPEMGAVILRQSANIDVRGIQTEISAGRRERPVEYMEEIYLLVDRPTLKKLKKLTMEGEQSLKATDPNVWALGSNDNKWKKYLLNLNPDEKTAIDKAIKTKKYIVKLISADNYALRNTAITGQPQKIGTSNNAISDQELENLKIQ